MLMLHELVEATIVRFLTSQLRLMGVGRPGIGASMGRIHTPPIWALRVWLPPVRPLTLKTVEPPESGRVRGVALSTVREIFPVTVPCPEVVATVTLAALP